jgi:ATP-dependent RNA helicase RhlE
MLPRERQTLFFSATMPSKIRTFAKQILRKPAEISIAISRPAERIVQGAYFVEDEGKVKLVENLLNGKKNLQRVLIFAGAKKKVRELTIALQRCGLKADAISSDLDQEERVKRLQAFRTGTLPIVVATDVLSRGIDIMGIDVVINYDVPADAEDYVHRIGRTARAEASGVALTLISRKDRRRFQRIEELMDMEVRKLPLPDGVPAGAPKSDIHAKRKPHRHRSDKRRSSSKGGPRS